MEKAVLETLPSMSNERLNNKMCRISWAELCWVELSLRPLSKLKILFEKASLLLLNFYFTLILLQQHSVVHSVVVELPLMVLTLMVKIFLFFFFVWICMWILNINIENLLWYCARIYFILKWMAFSLALPFRKCFMFVYLNVCVFVCAYMCDVCLIHA